MLFTSQLKQRYDKAAGESLHFAGATFAPINEDGMMIHITGVKTATGNVRAKVEYLSIHPDRMDAEHDSVQFDRVLSPVNFERFLNDMAMKVAVEKVGNRLIELAYSKNGYADPETMDEKTKHRMFKLFLILATQYKDTERAYHSIDELITHLENGGTEESFGRLIEKYMQAV